MVRKSKTLMSEARRKMNSIRRKERLKRMGKAPHWKKALARGPERPSTAKVIRKHKFKRLALPKLLSGYKPNKVNLNEPIDMVITWVDMSDSAWADKYEKHVNARPHWQRYGDHGELELCLASVCTYMPWIRTIYLVTDKQTPRYISDYPKVKIIDHDKILGDECVKPTFNSNVVESYTYKIPGLSECFLWGNDDCMVGQPIKKSDWFQNGLPKVTLRNRNLKSSIRGFEHSINNSIKMAESFSGIAAGHGRSVLQGTHQISICRKSACELVWEKFPDELKILAQCKVRGGHSSKQLQFYLLASILGIHTGLMSLEHSRKRYKTLHSNHHATKWFWDVLYNTPPLYCANCIKPAMTKQFTSFKTEMMFRMAGGVDKKMRTPVNEPRKLRPLILTCDKRVDSFEKFVSRYKKIAHTLLPPIVLVGHSKAKGRRKYDNLIKELNPYKIIEQPQYMNSQKDIKEASYKTTRLRSVYNHKGFLNLQKIMIEDFPKIALSNSSADEDIILLEDDGVFSTEFPRAIKKVSQYIQQECDFITLYSPTPQKKMDKEKSPSWNKKIWKAQKAMGWTKDGYTSLKSLPSNEFIHGIDGGVYVGNIAAVFSRRVLKSMKNNTGEIESIDRVGGGWDVKWGLYMQHNGFKMFATRNSYVDHSPGYSALQRGEVSTNSQNLLDNSAHFKIIIPAYNTEKWIAKTIESLKIQTHKNFQAIIIDDCSTDQTYDVAFKSIGDDGRFILIRNDSRSCALENTINGIEHLDIESEDIIAVLDGDDWLAGEKSLAIVENAYLTKKCLMTYGMWTPTNNDRGNQYHKFKKYSDKTIRRNSFREDAWRATALRTWKFKLWENLKDDDLRDSEGEYYSIAGDAAYMYPLLEMAGDKQEFVSEIVYIYNRHNPINDYKKDADEQSRVHKEIKSKPKYKKVIFPD